MDKPKTAVWQDGAFVGPDAMIGIKCNIPKEAAVDKAKVFWSGRSQAVRLPKSFRFEAGEVSIRRQGRAVILEPIHDDEWAWLDDVTGPLDKDFVAAAAEDPGEQHSPEYDIFM